VNVQVLAFVVDRHGLERVKISLRSMVFIGKLPTAAWGCRLIFLFLRTFSMNHFIAKKETE
jgi:hypothetical protein